MKTYICIVAFLFLLHHTALCQRYWIGAVSSDWNNSANWSSISGGAGGASVPGPTDQVFFDANAVNSCLISGNATISIFQMSAGNLSLSSSVNSSLTVNSVFTISGGTLNLGVSIANSLSVPNNTFNINGGTINGQQATIHVGSNLSVPSPSSFVPGTSKWIFDGPGQQDVILLAGVIPGLFLFYDLEINKPGNSIIRFTASSPDTFQVNNLLTLTAGRFEGSGFVKIERDVLTKINFGGTGIPFAMTGPNPGVAVLEAPFAVTGITNFVGIMKSSPSVTVSVFRSGGDDTLRIGNFDARFIVRNGILQFPGNPPIISRFRSLEIEPGGTFISTSNYLFHSGEHINTGGIFDANGGTYVFFYPFIPSRTHLTGNLETFNNLIIDNQTQFGPGTDDTLVVLGNLVFRSGELHGEAGSAFNLKGNMVFESGATQTFGVTNLIFSGTMDQQLTFAAGKEGAWNGSVIVNKPAGDLLLQSPMIIDEFGGRTVNFTRGIVKTSAANYLSFRNGSFAVNANNNSYVDGPVEYSWFNDFDFPVGNGGYYAPVRVSNTGADVMTAQYFHQNPSPLYNTALKSPTLNNVSVREYWMISKTGSNSPFVWLSYNQPRSGGIGAPVDLRVARWDGSLWQDLGNGQVSSPFVRSLTGVSTFSPFTLASVGLLNPLPVNFISFTAEPVNNGALLKWTTSDEINNHHFNIQRSPNGTNFSTIGQVPAGFNSGINQYDFTDNNLLTGRNIYRIQQVDFDGRSTYSSIAYLDQHNDQDVLKVYPNPASSVVTLQVAAWSNKKVMLEIFDVQSRMILKTQMQLSANGSWNWQQLPGPGMYMLRLNNGGIIRQNWVLVK